MAKFNKTVAVKGKIDNVVIVNDKFVDSDSGEELDVINWLGQIYKDTPFCITTSAKDDIDLETKK